MVATLWPLSESALDGAAARWWGVPAEWRACCLCRDTAKEIRARVGQSYWQVLCARCRAANEAARKHAGEPAGER